MVSLGPGRSKLRDERKKIDWTEELGPFALATYPVTRAQYGAVDSSHGAEVPITDVSWNDAIEFCNALSLRDGWAPCYTIRGGPDATEVGCDFSADGYRLPTEAEWEYACRAGTNTPRYGELDEIGWYASNSDGTIHEVGLKRANPWGLHDMIGNVWEWCWDVYDPDVYGPYRVFRGGGWCDEPRACRASCRRRSHPTFRIDDLGFRLARTLVDG